MNVLSWILFGLIVGIVANAVDPSSSRGGMLGAMGLGVVGAIVGGFLANFALGITVTGFNVTSFLIAIGGSLLLLFVGRVLRKTI